MTLHELWDVIAPPSRRLLGVFIVLSLIGHAVFFFFFKANNAPMHIATASQPRVTMISSNFKKSDAGQEMHSWLNLMNPMIIALPKTKPTRAEIKATFFPDATEAWSQITDPIPAIPSRAKPARPIESLGDITERAANSFDDYTASPMPIPVETPPQISGSQSIIDDSFSARPIIKKEALPQPRSKITLRSTVVRVGINNDGMVVHTLVDESSGDSAVDVFALKSLRSWVFSPKSSSDNTIDWGKIIIFWDQQPPQTPAQPPKT